MNMVELCMQMTRPNFTWNVLKTYTKGTLTSVLVPVFRKVVKSKRHVRFYSSFQLMQWFNCFDQKQFNLDFDASAKESLDFIQY